MIECPVSHRPSQKWISSSAATPALGVKTQLLQLAHTHHPYKFLLLVRGVLPLVACALVDLFGDGGGASSEGDLTQRDGDGPVADELSAAFELGLAVGGGYLRGGGQFVLGVTSSIFGLLLLVGR